MELDPRETAVVLIEYQNDFTSDGGALHGAVSDVMESTGMLANTGRAVARARDAGVVERNAFVKGSWGAEIIDELVPEKTDIVVEGSEVGAATSQEFLGALAGEQLTDASRGYDG